jgi:hypothetical protein
MDDIPKAVEKFGETAQSAGKAVFMFGNSFQEPIPWTGRKPYWEIKHFLRDGWVKEVNSNKFTDFIFKAWMLTWALGFRIRYRCPEIEAMTENLRKRFQRRLNENQE